MSKLDWIPQDYKRLAVINDCNIYSDDARTLAKGQWLNDNAITFILEMVFQELDASRQEQIHIVHASMCEILKYEKDNSSFQSYFQSANLSKKNIIIFVLNDNLDADKILGGMHWALLYFDRPKNEFLYLDSLVAINPGTLHSAQHIYTLFTSNNYLQTKSKPVFNPGRCAKQKNGSDCGMFVIEFSRAIMQLCGYNERTLKQIIPDDMSKNRDYWLHKIHELYSSNEKIQ